MKPKAPFKDHEASGVKSSSGVRVRRQSGSADERQCWRTCSPATVCSSSATASGFGCSTPFKIQAERENR